MQAPIKRPRFHLVVNGEVRGTYEGKAYFGGRVMSHPELPILLDLTVSGMKWEWVKVEE